MKVYTVDGWMGDIEWSEGIFATRELAEAEAERLWETRCSAKAPDWTDGFCKFAVEEHEVIGS